MKFLLYLFSNIKRAFLYFPTIVFCLGLIVGILFDKNLLFDNSFILEFFTSAIFLLFLFTKQRFSKNILLLLFSILIGSLRISSVGDDLFHYENQIKEVDFAESVNIEGLIADIYYDEGDTILTLYKIKSEEFEYGGKVLITVEGKFYFIRHSKVSLKAILKKPENYDDDFDYVEYLRKKEIFLLGESDEIYNTSLNKDITYVVDSFRVKAVEKVKKLFSEPESSLALGLTMGYRAEFPEDFTYALQKSGTTHIVAISGFNVSLLLIPLVGLSKYIGKKKSYILIIIFLFLLCILTGLTPSVLRASLMALLAIYVRELGRENNVGISLSIAVMVMLLFEPFLIYNLSFQLSVLSTMGLMFGMDLFKFKIPKNLKFLEMVSDSFISTLWVFIFTLPIIIENFSEFTILSFIANLLILPVVNIATILGIINIILLFVSFPISHVFAFITYIPFFYIQKVIKLISQIPIDMIKISFSFNTNHVFLYFFFLFIILMYISFNKFRKDIIEEG